MTEDKQLKRNEKQRKRAPHQQRNNVCPLNIDLNLSNWNCFSGYNSQSRKVYYILCICIWMKAWPEVLSPAGDARGDNSRGREGGIRIRCKWIIDDVTEVSELFGWVFSEFEFKWDSIKYTIIEYLGGRENNTNILFLFFSPFFSCCSDNAFELWVKIRNEFSSTIRVRNCDVDTHQAMCLTPSNIIVPPISHPYWIALPDASRAPTIPSLKLLNVELIGKLSKNLM